MNPRQGEIWLADLGLAAKVRPVVIVSRNDEHAPRVLFVYVPCTSQNRSSAYEVALSGVRDLKDETVANVQGIGSLPRPRFLRRIASLSPAEYQKIGNALRFLLDLSQTP
jgi:mRNA interferase MazF